MVPKVGQTAQLAFIAAASVAVFSFVRAAKNDAVLASCNAICLFRPTYAALDRTVPDFELPDMQGKIVRFSSLRAGKPVILNFWTKSCKPCLEEMPSLAQLAQIVGKDGVKVVTISTDDGPDDVRDHLQVVLGGAQVPFEILFDPDAKVVGGMFGTTLFPETWLIDAAGVIRARVDGARDWTSPLALDVISAVGRRGACPVEFALGVPGGRMKALCDAEL
ncbi:MAG: TlpA family protein disulfide reductase [Myxococcales bacterium]|nr:TlpA family protein disulfide reductase [Myxococcales bacterium]